MDVSSGARDDLLDISVHLAEFSVRRALRFIDVFEGCINDIRQFPDIGRAVEGEPALRRLSRGGYIFVYERSEGITRLLRILDGRQRPQATPTSRRIRRDVPVLRTRAGGLVRGE